MTHRNYHHTHFVTSAPDIRHLPSDTGIEVAFAGRSNAGKSSALNTLTNQKSLARTSKTPGRTQLINLFEVAEGKRLVDQVLEERGRRRRIRQVVPYFLAGLHAAATTDCVVTVSDRAAQALAGTLGLRLLAPPLPLASYPLHLLWHPRLEEEPANRWLREVFVRAAAEAAPEPQGAPGRPPDGRRRR